ncbi:DUF397 domain-containing protein [Micromonospora chalcea]|uniref:DUF397 domain-containing protein n=2 Tax=Micromonospora TaxID=1873 RepID=A0ABX9Y694_MICCH|nr:MULTISPECIES: DUF397 domain-containing protein [Micromonospora]RQW94539.1 DUF397 domain-containing protein [Micromonospora chalcea]RQX29851.1 DUF397 domain-containing protein [Micromonospora chalcea]
MTDTSWKKSRRSLAGDNNCVEVRLTPHFTAVRDSKNPDGSRLYFTKEAWMTFVSTLKA